MNEFAKEWVKALRSGEYKQGKHRLHRGNVFCCLGVACDLYQKKFGDLDVGFYEFGDITMFSYDGHEHGLPEKVRNSLSIGDSDISALIELNDGGRTFLEIADIIETRIIK